MRAVALAILAFYWNYEAWKQKENSHDAKWMVCVSIVLMIASGICIILGV